LTFVEYLFLSSSGDLSYFLFTALKTTCILVFYYVTESDWQNKATENLLVQESAGFSLPVIDISQSGLDYKYFKFHGWIALRHRDALRNLNELVIFANE